MLFLFTDFILINSLKMIKNDIADNAYENLLDSFITHKNLHEFDLLNDVNL